MPRTFNEEVGTDAYDPTVETGSQEFDYDAVSRSLNELSDDDEPEDKRSAILAQLTRVSKIVIQNFCRWLIDGAPMNKKQNTEAIDVAKARSQLFQKFGLSDDANSKFTTVETAALIDYIIKQKLKSRQHGRADAIREHAQEIAVGRKAILTVWLKDPKAFKEETDSGVSLHQIAESLAMTTANLSPQVRKISEELGITNQFQDHDWRRNNN